MPTHSEVIERLVEERDALLDEVERLTKALAQTERMRQLLLRKEARTSTIPLSILDLINREVIVANDALHVELGTPPNDANGGDDAD